jgi:hypothetical protein
MVYQHSSDDRDRLIADRLDDMAREAGLIPTSADGESLGG